MHNHHVPTSTDAAIDSEQPVQGPTGDGERASTPDLSPRGDLEAEDPPTPRMYKAITPIAAPGEMQSHVSAPHSPRLQSGATQVVLHQGHYDHGRQHASPQRHAHHKGRDQAVEELRHTVRHALTAHAT